MIKSLSEAGKQALGQSGGLPASMPGPRTSHATSRAERARDDESQNVGVHFTILALSQNGYG